jgi:putative ABC transport system ATP-binding protein
MNIFQALNQTKGITIVMVTHSDEIATYAGRIIHFRDGLIVADAKVAKVAKPARAPLVVAMPPVEVGVSA